MPGIIANEIIIKLNKKRITPEEILQNPLTDIARDIAIIEPDPKDWGWWVHYLIEHMKREAERKK